MATHANILAWKIPWRRKAGRLQFMGSQRVGHKEHAHTRRITCFLPKLILTPVLDGCLRKEKNKLVEIASE